MKGAKVDEKESIPESIVIDTILQRYKWTLDEYYEQYDKYPEYFGELMIIMSAEGEKKRANHQQSERKQKEIEMEQRRKRLGVI